MKRKITWSCILLVVALVHAGNSQNSQRTSSGPLPVESCPHLVRFSDSSLKLVCHGCFFQPFRILTTLACLHQSASFQYLNPICGNENFPPKGYQLARVYLNKIRNNIVTMRHLDQNQQEQNLAVIQIQEENNQSGRHPYFAEEKTEALQLNETYRMLTSYQPFAVESAFVDGTLAPFSNPALLQLTLNNGSTFASQDIGSPVHLAKSFNLEFKGSIPNFAAILVKLIDDGVWNLTGSDARSTKALILPLSSKQVRFFLQVNKKESLSNAEVKLNGKLTMFVNAKIIV